MRERGSKKRGACRLVCGELYVLNGHVKRIPPMFVTLLWQYFYSYYWWESYHLRKIFKSGNKTLPFYQNGQGMCLPGCFENVALKGVFALVNRCLVFHFGRDSIESKLNEGRILIVWPTWTGWADGPEEGRSRHLLNLELRPLVTWGCEQRKINAQRGFYYFNLIMKVLFKIHINEFYLGKSFPKAIYTHQKLQHVSSKDKKHQNPFKKTFILPHM